MKKNIIIINNWDLMGVDGIQWILLGIEWKATCFLYRMNLRFKRTTKTSKQNKRSETGTMG